DEFLRRNFAWLQRQVGGAGRNTGAAANAAAIGGKTEFATGRGRQEPVVEHAVLDHHEALARYAFAVEGARGRAADNQRVVGNVQAGLQHLLTGRVTQEACLAGHGRAIDGAGNVANAAAGDARIEDDGDVAARVHLARVEALHRPL